MVADGKMGGGRVKGKNRWWCCPRGAFHTTAKSIRGGGRGGRGKDSGSGTFERFFLLSLSSLSLFSISCMLQGAAIFVIDCVVARAPPSSPSPLLPRRIHFRTIWVQLIRPHLINKRSSPLSTYCSPCQHITPLPDTHTHTHTETLTPSTWAQPPRRAPWLKEPES